MTRRNPQPPDPNAAYWPMQRAADLLHVSVDTIRRRIADGTLPAFRVGGQLRVRSTDVHALAVPVPTVRAGR